MRKLTKTVVIAIPLCAVLLAIGLILFSYSDCADLPQRVYHTKLLREKDFIGQNIRFKTLMQGTGRTPGGYATDFLRARASDCVEVIRTTEPEGSPIDAENEMKKRIHEASQVIEQGPHIDATGQNVGERVVLLYAREATKIIIIRRKDDCKLYTIESNS